MLFDISTNRKIKCIQHLHLNQFHTMTSLLISNWCSNAKHFQWVFIFVFFIQLSLSSSILKFIVFSHLTWIHFNLNMFYSIKHSFLSVHCCLWALWQFSIVIAIVVDVNNADCINAFKFKFKCRQNFFAFFYLLRLRVDSTHIDKKNITHWTLWWKCLEHSMNFW